MWRFHWLVHWLVRMNSPSLAGDGGVQRLHRPQLGKLVQKGHNLELEVGEIGKAGGGRMYEAVLRIDALARLALRPCATPPPRASARRPTASPG